jgi:hypothetical protein
MMRSTSAKLWPWSFSNRGQQVSVCGVRACGGLLAADKSETVERRRSGEILALPLLRAASISAVALLQLSQMAISPTQLANPSPSLVSKSSFPSNRHRSTTSGYILYISTLPERRDRSPTYPVIACAAATARVD